YSPSPPTWTYSPFLSVLNSVPAPSRHRCQDRDGQDQSFLDFVGALHGYPPFLSFPKVFAVQNLLLATSALSCILFTACGCLSRTPVTTSGFIWSGRQIPT